MKGQPLAYNKDNQEDKEPLFDTADQVRGCLRVFADMIPAITPRREAMRAAASRGFATATDLADYLVRKGVPFRDAHEAVGKAVALGVTEGRDLSELSLDELRGFSPAIGAGRLRGPHAGRVGRGARPPGRNGAPAGPRSHCPGAGAAGGLRQGAFPVRRARPRRRPS